MRQKQSIDPIVLGSIQHQHHLYYYYQYLDCSTTGNRNVKSFYIIITYTLIHLATNHASFITGSAEKSFAKDNTSAPSFLQTHFRNWDFDFLRRTDGVSLKVTLMEETWNEEEKSSTS